MPLGQGSCPDGIAATAACMPSSHLCQWLLSPPVALRTDTDHVCSRDLLVTQQNSAAEGMGIMGSLFKEEAHLQNFIGVEELRFCATMLGGPENQQQKD